MGDPLLIVLVEGTVPEGPPDRRRAARRGLDVWLSSGGEDAVGVDASSPLAARAEARLVVEEPEAAVVRGALGKAVRTLLSSDGAPVVPEGFYPGAPRPAEPYATLWELEALAQETRQGRSLFALPDGNAAPPAVLDGPGSSGAPVAASGLLVHSFAGRKGHARPDVAELVPSSARSILEVGCAQGMLGEALQAGGGRVTGIESDPLAAAEAAGRLHRVIAEPLERALERLDERFDTFVLADVLEHLEDPVSALRGLAARAAQDARLVVSLPNASNAAVLAGLLQGRFDVALEGTVADDHRTYAGRPGWTRVLRAGGWEVERWVGVPLVAPRLVPWLPVLALGGLSETDLSALQWLAVLRLSGSAAEALELGPSEDAATRSLDPDDPVGALMRALETSGSAQFTLPNAAGGAHVDRLLAGEVVTGEGRRALARAVTADALLERLAGVDAVVRVDPRDARTLPSGLERVLSAASAAGLPVRRDALVPHGLELSVAER